MVDPSEPSQPFQQPSLQGSSRSVTTTQQQLDTVEQAFDYRGDVTVHTNDGRVVEGYVFDRRDDALQPYLRIILANRQERLDIPYADITRLAFSGRDTAAGKSWQTWVEKYQEKRQRGESASLEPDPLD